MEQLKRAESSHANGRCGRVGDTEHVELTVESLHGNKKSFQRQFPRGSSARAMLAHLSLQGVAVLRFRGAPLTRELPADAREGEVLRVVSKAPLRGGGCGSSKVHGLAPNSRAMEAAAKDVRRFMRANPALRDRAGLGSPPQSVVQAEAAPAPAGSLPPHFGVQALLDSVKSGAIAPLRGRFVVALHARGGRLARRQDLPPEAFFSPAELCRLVEALGDDYGLLFVALSYRCAPALIAAALPRLPAHRVGRACVPSAGLSKGHPDPDGFHLDIVAAVAKLYLNGSTYYAKGAEGSPLAAAFKKAGLGEDAADFALFWDFARRSLPRDSLNHDACAHFSRHAAHPARPPQPLPKAAGA